MAQDSLGKSKIVFTHIAASTSTSSRAFFVSGNRVFYSKIIEGDIDIGRCHQINDPTHDEFSDVLDSDGGVISIKDAGFLTAIVAFRKGVLAASSEGCWYISAAESFTPTSIQVSKITDYGIAYPDSIVTAGQNAFYLNQGGIVGVQTNEFETVQGTLITDQTIRSYIVDTFTANTEANEIKASFESKLNEIQWTNASNNSFLIFDLNTGGFYPQAFSFNDETSKVIDVIPPRGTESSFSYAVNRPDAGANPQSGTVTLGSLTRTDFADDDGSGTAVEYDAYMEAGPESLGQFALKKSVTSIALAFNRTEQNIIGFDDTPVTGEGLIYDNPSSCLLNTRWDNSSYEGYTSKPRQVYLLNRRRWIPNEIDYPFDISEQGDDIVYYEDKLRGNRKLVSFRFEAEKGKDMQLLGFSVDFSMKGRQR